MYLNITLNPGREKSIVSGHPWIFSGAIEKVSDAVIPGAMVHVITHNGKFVARGYYNPSSNIAIRVLTYDKDEVIDEAFFVRRFQRALDGRRSLMNMRQTNAYRLVNSEGDFLPGLIVDVYAGFAVVQFHTMGMEVFRQEVVDALVQVLKPVGIFERSDLHVRKLEGVETKPIGVLYGAEPPPAVEIVEHGVKFGVDIVNGQKTGFFLDQRDNRKRVGEYVSGLKQALGSSPRVLNLFSYTGGFSLYAAKNGGVVTTVDSSVDAVGMARKNFSMNDLNIVDHEFVEADVFDLLPKYKKEGRPFDMVIVDPPSFGKRKGDMKNALRAYTDVNRQAIQLIPSGGILVAASCTHFVTPEMFWDCLRGAASLAKRQLQILEVHGQPLDHAMSVHFPEGQYLKCYFCRVV